jgi:hypothetical protein
MDVAPHNDRPTHLIRVRPAVTDRQWLDLWEWLLSPSDDETAESGGQEVASQENQDEGKDGDRFNGE